MNNDKPTDLQQQINQLKAENDLLRRDNRSLRRDLLELREEYRKLKTAGNSSSDVTPPPPSDKGIKTILLVEDNKTNQLLASKLIKKIGFSVIPVVNGKEAVDMYASHKFAVILMDCHMPEMDGFEATRQIRKLPGNHVPIIALTASDSQQDRRECLESGMDDFLPKPFSFEQLHAILEKYAGPLG